MKRVLALLLFAILTACQPSATMPPRSADEMLAFNSNRDGHTEVYTIRGDGSNQTRLTVFKQAENMVATWSPDGMRLAFISRQDEEAQVYLIRFDGTRQVNLTNAYLTGNVDVSDPAVLPNISTPTVGFAPTETAEDIRTLLFGAQLAVKDNPVSAAQQHSDAESAYGGGFAAAMASAAPETDARIRDGFAAAGRAINAGNVPAFAAARSQIWTSILTGSLAVIEHALKQGDGVTARLWLPLREFRTLTTRFARTNVDATLAVDGLIAGSLSPAEALKSLRADLLDTYQARLNQSLRDLAQADANGFAARRAEYAALAEGYFLMLAPAYTEQRGVDASAQAAAAFADLRTQAVSGADISAAMGQVAEHLRDFRAAPLSVAEQSRRSGQLMRYLSLVPVEYRRGVAEGQVVRDFEIQEAIAFEAGAYAAFTDLEYLLEARDPAATARTRTLLEALAASLDEAGKQTTVAHPDEIQTQVKGLLDLLKATMPAEWARDTSQADIYEIYDADPAWSPDGRQIALISNDGVELEAGGELNIYVMAPNGADPQAITKGRPKYNGVPAWSPDGKKIAFVSDRDHNLELYLMNADGTQQVNLTNSAGADQSFAWSPDGSQIVFVSERDGNGEIYVINADGSGAVNLSKRPGGFDDTPVWSPDGKKIAWAATENGQSDIYVMNADGSGQVNLTNTPKAYDISPRWSPDGSQIAFVSNRDGNLEIYVMNADGTWQVNLTNHPAEDTSPLWRP